MSRKLRRHYYNKSRKPYKNNYKNESEEEYEDRQYKSWTLHDLAIIKPLTKAQEEMVSSFEEGNHIVAFGSSGSGKSFLALYLAMNEVLSPQSKTDHIILVRSAVQTRDLGYLKGTLEEKLSAYENPYRDIFCEIVGRLNTYDDMKREELIQFITTSFVRSLTFNNAIIILDEAQNCTFHEISSIVTRTGENSRVIVIGDLAQNDLVSKKERTGFDRFIRIAEKMPEFSLIHFTRDDIVRSTFVKSFIIASEETL